MKWLSRINPVAAIFAFAFIVSSVHLWSQQSKSEKASAAIEAGNNAEAIIAIDGMWNKSIPDKNGRTPIITACKEGNAEILEYLINSGIDVTNTKYDSYSEQRPLEAFCSSGWKNNPKMLQILLDAGADPNDYRYKPALFILAEQAYWKLTITEKQKDEIENMCLELIKAGAELQYENETILHLAAKADMAELFDALIHSKDGIELINAKNQDELTPWETAAKYGAVEVQQAIQLFEQELNEILEEEEQEDAQEEATEPTEFVNPFDKE